MPSEQGTEYVPKYQDIAIGRSYGDSQLGDLKAKAGGAFELECDWAEGLIEGFDCSRASAIERVLYAA